MERKAAALHTELYLPIDQVVATELEPGAETKVVWTMDFGSGKVRSLLWLSTNVAASNFEVKVFKARNKH